MLAYECIGQGSPLVLIHGVGHDRSAWRPVLAALSDQRELIMLDLPGHGASSPWAAAGMGNKTKKSESSTTKKRMDMILLPRTR